MGEGGTVSYDAWFWKPKPIFLKDFKVCRMTMCNENSIITFKCITSISFFKVSICACLRPKIILHLFYRKRPIFTHSLSPVIELSGKQILAKRQICTRGFYISIFFYPKMNCFSCPVQSSCLSLFSKTCFL